MTIRWLPNRGAFSTAREALATLSTLSVDNIVGKASSVTPIPLFPLGYSFLLKY
jgi:hypothetical protein